MIITCPDRMAQAIDEAIRQDDAMTERAARIEDVAERVRALREARASRSLLLALSSRLRIEAAMNADDARPDIMKTLGKTADTIVSADFARLSFFFQEIWRDPLPPMRKDATYWHITDTASGWEKWTSDYAEMARYRDIDHYKVVENTLDCASGCLCGGIIYHAAYEDGKPSDHGAWSTHT